ncbi:phenoloxidase-activating enzyme-like [Leguminivora glycinivorella]|uniref:phenoloxidase-activating enzyme-like n=1 Tax=Leguminivora glycinivorella TaxID=1035111 RepID=UPI00200D54CC|nr:phenoloxidase-activating enzyme-like [Leguminivora glycinivorella]
MEILKMDLLTFICVVMLLRFSSGNAEDCKSSSIPPNPGSGCCGRAVGVTKAIPGFYAQLSQYPWIGIIEHQKENKTKLLCSAILISGRYMLSAAQCFGPTAEQIGKPTNVRLGEYITSNDGPDCVEVGGSQECNDGALRIPIEKVTTHPDFHREQNFQHDIALIRLAQIAPITDFIKPICLPTSDITAEPPQQRMWTAGWGANNQSSSPSDRLHHIDLPYVDLDTCQAAFNISKIRQLKLGQGQLCAGGEEGKDSCKGDAGGPLMYTRDRTTEVVGIVSFGAIPCGKAGVPGVYTNVFAYDAWIRANIED